MEGDIARPAGSQSLRAIFYGWWLVAIGILVFALVGAPTHATEWAQSVRPLASIDLPDLESLGI